MDLQNPTLPPLLQRIIRKMMEHFAHHPAIIGYQVDNEVEALQHRQSGLFRGLPRLHQDFVPQQSRLAEPPLGTELLGHEYQQMGGFL